MCIRDRDMGILTIGVATKPFAFEGKKRMESAEKGIVNLRQYVDSLIVIPNERLKSVSETRITPVSYTHLDVYKRQETRRFQWQKALHKKKRSMKNGPALSSL